MDKKKIEKKRKEDIFTTLVIRKLSLQFTKIVVKTPLTPNQVTIFSFLLGALAAYGFSTGQWGWLIAGGILVQLSYVFDCVDGEVARYHGIVSKTGAWLDETLDRLKEALIFLGLSMGLWMQTGHYLAWVMGFLAFISVYMLHVILDNSAKEFGKEKLKDAHSEFFLTKWLGKKIPANYLAIGIGIYLLIISIGAILNQIIWIFIYFITIQNLYWIIIFLLILKKK